MPATRLSDIIVPQVWNDYMLVRTLEKSALFQSGIAIQTEELNQRASGPSSTVNMPFFQDLGGDSDGLSDTVALTVNNITTGRDVAAKHFQGKAWGANELTASLSGDDPMSAIAELVAAWWARDMQKRLIASLTGVFASTAMAASHVVNIATETGNSATDSNRISASATIDAFARLGDETDALTAIAMHSVTYHRLLKQDLIQFEAVSVQGNPIRTYLGKTVIVDDSMPVRAGTTNGQVYTTYLFGAGVIGYGEGNPETPVETDRDSLLGDDYLINRRHYIMHPAGVRWQGTPAGLSPTLTELRAGANWLKVYPDKNIRIVALQHNP